MNEKQKNVLEAIEERRSCRQYKSDMVPREIIEKIVKAGTYAATGMGKQSPIIIAVTDKALRDKLSKMNAAVMGNLMLAASTLGVASCWIHRAKEEFESEEGKEILKSLGIEGDYEGIGHCILGYAASEIPAAAPRKENYVYWAE